MDFGNGSSTQIPSSNGFFQQSNPFGSQEQEEDDNNGESTGWATAFGSGEQENNYSLDFVTPQLKEVVTSATKGQGGKTGLVVKAGFTMIGSPRSIAIQLEVKNVSGQQVKDFDIMFNKNPFGISIAGATGALQFPNSDPVSKTLPCIIDKKNLDSKNPPKHPFNIQVAIKSSLDVFYFEVPCLLHCLIDHANPLKPEEFKKFWGMIPESNETTLSIPNLYPGFNSSKFNGGDLASNLADGLTNNGFVNLAKVPKKDSPTPTTMLYFGAKTINNLPLLLEVAAVAGSK